MFGMSLTLAHTGGTFSGTLFVVCLASVWLSLALGQRAQVPAFMAALLDAIRHTWLPRFLSWFRNSFFSKLDQSCPGQCIRKNLRCQIWATATDGHVRFEPSPGLRWLPRTRVRPGSGLGNIHCMCLA